MSVKQRAEFYERFMAEAVERRSQALTLHQAGKSYAVIAAVLGVSKKRAYDLVQRAKLDAGIALQNP